MSNQQILESYLRWRCSLSDVEDKEISDVVMQFERRKKQLDKIAEEYEFNSSSTIRKAPDLS